MANIIRSEWCTGFGLLCSVCTFCSQSAMGQELHSVSVCYDPASEDLRHSANSSTATFFNYVVVASFAQIGVKVNFDLQHTFKGCMELAQNGGVDFVQGAYYDEERAKIFDYSDHYHTLTPQAFYRNDSPIKITQLSDLKKYRGCGIYGSSYAHYGLTQKDLDLGPGYESMVKKLLAKRCDYFVEEVEVFYEMGPQGKTVLENHDIVHMDVPGASAPSRYLITKKNSAASQLLPKFNKALSQVINLPQAKEFWIRDHGNVVYKR